MDREKVIKGLECHAKGARGCLFDCPYGNENGCQLLLCSDALAMLKEQEELLHKKEKDIDKLCVEISRLKHQIHDNEPTFEDWTKGEGR